METETTKKNEWHKPGCLTRDLGMGYSCDCEERVQSKVESMKPHFEAGNLTSVGVYDWKAYKRGRIEGNKYKKEEAKREVARIQNAIKEARLCLKTAKAILKSIRKPTTYAMRKDWKNEVAETQEVCRRLGVPFKVGDRIINAGANKAPASETGAE